VEELVSCEMPPAPAATTQPRRKPGQCVRHGGKIQNEHPKEDAPGTEVSASASRVWSQPHVTYFRAGRPRPRMRCSASSCLSEVCFCTESKGGLMFDQLLAYPLFFPCLIPVVGEWVRGKKKIPNHNNPPKKKQPPNPQTKP